MKRVIQYLLKSEIGKAIVKQLIMEFFKYVEKEFSVSLFPIDEKTQTIIAERFVNDKLK
jgi:RNase H-fold protein (predicted Holliday junction resolvase)